MSQLSLCVMSEVFNGLLFYFILKKTEDPLAPLLLHTLPLQTNMFLYSSKEAVRGEVSLFLLLGSAGSCVCVGLLDFAYRRWGEWREG
jgi:hypothetical protein